MSQHRSLAQETFESICDKLEIMFNFDVDIETEKLSVATPKGTFLMNYHGVMDQIWLSSPLTGAHHFALIDSKWQCTRSQQLLEDVLLQDLESLDPMATNNHA